MNQTPRILNRIVIGVLGAVLALVGGTGLLLALVPSLSGWWAGFSADTRQVLDQVFASTTVAGQRDSWLWIAIALSMIVLTALMIAWVTAQGKGRVGTLASDYSEDPAPGRITLSAAVAEQAMKTALLDRRDIVNVTVSTWEFKGRPALKIRVHPRQGVGPYAVAEEVADLVRALDLTLGHQPPVLISIGAGARSHFSRPERVR
ncbi:hypothetical protein [Arthrobacter roseus]|uniref:hypothetical protein n=1 Tax=Arthrobacter roseus TaxID=136274 RepID=UPI001964EDC7|nr:hypothetical protein [Arthrobacter roseus]MBM7847365.1 hypothetical protein [Arthrobacter roseus]